MDRFRITGPTRLEGRVRASGAKNAALPALAASLLATEPLRLDRVPRVRDIRTMRRLLDHLGVDSRWDGGTLVLDPDGDRTEGDAPYDLVKTMRASVLSLGPLVAKRHRARVSLPGGCAIGVRPVDQHIKGLEALGATVELTGGYIEATAPEGGLVGERFRFRMPTVTGTENLLMAAVLAKGTTVLENCAREPEIVDLARLLRTMGAKITGDGEETIEIEGVDHLTGGAHSVIADRIEGGTYLVGAALTGGDVTLEGARAADLAPLLEQLARVGAEVSVTPGDPADRDGEDILRVSAEAGSLRGHDMETEPHPGFPTDLQAQYVALMTQAQGSCEIRETVFENRFQHIPELSRMGARIEVQGNRATVHGPTPLTGSTVMATDLRASACLVLAGLVADGVTEVDRIYHLDRGYEKMEQKLATLGARVERVSGPAPT